MPTASDVEALRRAQRALSRAVERDLSGLWASLDLNRPERARDELLVAVPALTTAYGAGAAVVSADWYDAVRIEEGVTGRFSARMADPFPTEYVQDRVRFGARHLFTETPAQMLPFLSGAVQEYALQPGRDTIQQSTAADPQAVGWHRETRAGACKFCVMLAGRGGVYFKEKSASFAAHGNCMCVAVPSWDANAREVPVSAYVASERMGALKKRAASGDASAQRQVDANRKRVREYMDRMDD